MLTNTNNTLVMKTNRILMAKITFSTDDHATIYDVVIEGVTSNGRLIRECKEISPMPLP